MQSVRAKADSLASQLDWGDRIQITGYWTIESDSSKAYEPPEELTKFLKQARQEEKKLVYIGFGSIPLSHPRDTMEVIYEVSRS